MSKNQYGTRQVIIVKEKTRKERRADEVTLTLVAGVVASVVGFSFLLVMLIKLIG